MGLLNERQGLPAAPVRHRGARRGIALFLVISILLILTIVATGFAAFISADMKASQTNYEQTECYFLAEAGIDYAIFLLKHNMTVYPAPPVYATNGVNILSTTQYLDGIAPGVGRSIANGNYYYQAYPVYNTGSGPGPIPQTTGSLINLNYLTAGQAAGAAGQEHVVIEDLAFNAEVGSPASNANWLNGVRFCGTFIVQQQVVPPGATANTGIATNGTVNASGNQYQIYLKSIGYIKQIPAAVSTTTLSAYGGVTGVGSWTVQAQRTVEAQVTVTGASSFSVTVPIQRIQVQEYSEKFR